MAVSSWVLTSRPDLAPCANSLHRATLITQWGTREHSAERRHVTKSYTIFVCVSFLLISTTEIVTLIIAPLDYPQLYVPCVALMGTIIRCCY